MKYQGRALDEFAALDQELDGAGASVANGLRELHGSRAHLLAQRRRHPGRGRFLDHLLVAALQGAVALEQVDDVAVAVAEHLHLDMAGRDNELLDQHVGISERGHGFALRAVEQIGEVGAGPRQDACRVRRRQQPP